MTTKLLIAATAVALFAGPALAADLVYTPVSPSFGGNPLNSTHLMATANAQRDATASDAIDDMLGGGGTTGTGTGTDTGNNDADLFVRQLQGRLLSALAGQVTDAIFGDNPQDSGTVIFGDTQVEFNRSLTSIDLTITDFTDGSVTTISVPQLLTSTN